MKIAIVEDNAMMGLWLAIALQDAGYEVVGPFHRLDEVQALPEAQGPEVALLDLHLGHGECGADIGQHLADRFGTVGVFVTADRVAAERNRGRAVGYVLKPVVEDDVLGVVAYLEARRAGAGGVPAPEKLILFGEP